MSALAPTLQAFFTDRLIRQRQASPNTIGAYRDAFRLLLGFASTHTGKQPSQLDVSDLDAAMVTAFLDHLEHDRHNSISTRNARLAVIRSLFRFAALHHPEHAAVIERVLAIPPKRFDRALIDYLTDPEIDALLAAPDPSTWTGRRDHAFLTLAIQTGLRLSELIGLSRNDVHLSTGPHVACHGKGRKDRITPLTPNTVDVLTGWLTERGGEPHDPLFCSRPGSPLSRDAIERRLAIYADRAAAGCPSLHTKKVSAHVLRHTAAMRLLHAGGHVRDRIVARSRERRNDSDLPPRRSCPQRKSHRPNDATGQRPRPIPTLRRDPRVPRRSVTMPTRRAREPPQSAASSVSQHQIGIIRRSA